MATFREHTDTVNCIRLSPDSRWVASGSNDGSLKIWDVRNNRLVQNFDIPNQRVTCLEFNPSHLTLANGSSDRTVKYWDLENFQSITQTRADSSEISHIQFSGENDEHLFAVSPNHMRVWNVENNKLLDCLQCPPKPVADFNVTYHTRYMLFACILNNTLSMYYTSLKNINFDEDVDTIPSSSNEVRH